MKKPGGEKEQHLTRLAGGIGADTLIGYIKAEHLENFLVGKRAEGCRQATINAYTNYFRHFFRWLVHTRKLTESPAGRLETRNPGNERTRFLWPDEASRLLAACNKVVDAKHLKPIIIVALNTGMRESEIFHLRWADVNLRARFTTIRKSKNDEGRHIPMNDTLMACLKELGQGRRMDTDLLFPSKNKQGHLVPLTSVKNSFATALEIAKITDFHFHDLRHTFASWAVMSGMSLYKLAKILGHKSIKMTERYAHLAPNHLTDITTSVNDFFTAKKENSETYGRPEDQTLSGVLVSN